MIAPSAGPSGTPGPGERQGVGRVDLEEHARVLGAEVIGVGGPHALVFERWPHRDELRQVVAQRPEAVVDPRADRRVAAVEQMPAGEELQLGAVVVVGRVHRADHGDVVDAAAHVRPPVADLDPALPPFLEADLRRIDRRLCLVDDVVGDLLADVLEIRRVEDRRLCGLSLIVLPACLVNSGLGSKLSRWLTPPRIISQMTRFARGGKWGLPSGGIQP